MRKTSVWVLCGLMGLATAAVAAAQTGSTGAMGTESGSMSSGSTGSMSGSGDMAKSTTHKSSKKHTAAKSSSMTGEVTDAAADGNFTLKNKKSEKKFLCSESTKFTAKGKACSDIAKDQNLTVWYSPTSNVVPTPAMKIRWNKAKAAAAAPAAAATTPK